MVVCADLEDSGMVKASSSLGVLSFCLLSGFACLRSLLLSEVCEKNEGQKMGIGTF